VRRWHWLLFLYNVSVLLLRIAGDIFVLYCTYTHIIGARKSAQ
jgi:hypothetical protein